MQWYPSACGNAAVRTVTSFQIHRLPHSERITTAVPSMLDHNQPQFPIVATQLMVATRLVQARNDAPLFSREWAVSVDRSTLRELGSRRFRVGLDRHWASTVPEYISPPQ
jgi:hypothetical protein